MAASPASPDLHDAPAGPPPTRTRALLLVNRKARRGKGDLSAALGRLRAAGFEFVEERVDVPTQLAQVVRRHRDRVDAVIIGGGDGTLTMAADGLVDAQLPLGILPLGTANDLARTLNLPLDPAVAAGVIAAGHQRRIDLGWVNGTHFFNVATVGLGVGVTRRLNRERKSRWGVLAYLFAAAQVVTRARPFAADIRTGTETVRVRTVQVTVGNGRHFGGGMTVDQAATIDDGVLHLVSLEAEHWWQLVALLPAMWRGTQWRARHIRTLRGREFEITPVKKRKKKVTADGEVSSRTPAVIRLVPRALSVFVPPPASPGEHEVLQ
jgi:YegS/Rv2252/BmrU family lipid kinase